MNLRTVIWRDVVENREYLNKNMLYQNITTMK